MSAVSPGVAEVGVRARSSRRSIPVVMGFCFLVAGAVAVMAIFGTWLAPQNPNTQNVAVALAKPSGAHLLGTDELGRDVFSRVIVGTRSALLGPLLITLGAVLFGNLLGLLAGYRGGKVDATIMRWVDLMWSIPGLLVIIVVAGTVHGGYWLAVVLLMILSVPFDTRIVRGAVLEQVPRPYVEAAKTLGVPDRRIMLSHIWPNIAAVAVATAFLDFAGALVGLSALSFLGLGAPVGTPDWGLMLAEGQPLLFANPVSELAPGVMIVLTATSMNLIGDWLYERLSSRGVTR